MALRTALERDVAHAQGGFREDRAGSLPQRANPHMHLFEAALAWMELDADPGWRRMADGIAALCLDKFIDPASGALRENFAADWSPAPGIAGRVCEPGHHYEWAFLLDRWSELSGRPRPVAVARLIAFADDHGVDVQRGVAVGAVLSDGALHDPVARLWAQAERIRAYAIDRQPGDAERIAAAIRGLRRFLATPTPGLWYDRLDGDDRLISEPARATSLYHIIGAVAELEKLQLAASAATRTRPGAGHLRPPRLVYLVTEDWYFISHRLPMARAARDAGYEVHVATHVDRHRAAIEAEGFFLHPLDWRRGSFDPRDLLRVIGEIRRLYRRLQPDLAHHVAVQAALVGSLAAIGLPVVCLNAATGLGTSFLGNSAKARIASPVAAVLMRALLNRSRSAVLVQNSDDRAEIERLGVEAGRIALIPGSGVDTDVLKPAPEPAGPITIAFAGRLVEDKGIRTLIAAHDLLDLPWPRHPAVDRRASRCGQPDLDPACRDQGLEQPAEPQASRIRGRHRGILGVRPHRRAAVPARGIAADAPRGCRLRAPAGRHRRSRMPGNRAGGRQRAAGAAGRCAGACRRDRPAGGGSGVARQVRRGRPRPGRARILQRANRARRWSISIAACSRGAAPQVRCEPRAGHAKGSALEHDPEKCKPVFRPDHAPLRKTGAQSVNLK